MIPTRIPLNFGPFKKHLALFRPEGLGCTSLVGSERLRSPNHPSDGKKAVLTGSLHAVSTVLRKMEKATKQNFLPKIKLWREPSDSLLVKSLNNTRR